MGTHETTAEALDRLYEERLERVRQERAERGLVPDGWREPIYPRDYLVEVWRLAAAGEPERACRLLAGIWSWAIDNFADEKGVRVALALMDRLGFVTDDPEEWAALPPELDVYRAESNPADLSQGLCWTLDSEIADMFAQQHGSPVTRGRIAKTDALAYITHRGESEIVVRRACVQQK